MTVPRDQALNAPGTSVTSSVARRAARSPRRRPASARTRCRCAPSSRSGRPRPRRRARSPRRADPRARSASKIGIAMRDVVRRAAAHQAVAVRPCPRPRRRPRSRRSRCRARRGARRCGLSSVHLELPPSMTRSPAASSPPSASTVSRVGSPAGTMTHTTRGAASFATRSASDDGVADLRVAVEADDRVPGGAQPLAHVAAHAPEPDQSHLHGVAPSEGERVWRRVPTRSGAGQPESRTGMSR